MSIITPEELREHVETELEDDALQLHIDAAEQAIDPLAGPLEEITEERHGGSRIVILARPAASITSVFEDDGETELEEETDYRLLSDRRSLRRVDQEWSGRVHVVSVPLDSLALRQLVVIQLVRHAIIGIPGILGFTEGNWSIQFASGETWSSAREDALSGLAAPWHFG